MNILFLSLSKFENLESRGIYTDLVNKLASENNNIYVVSPIEKRETLVSETLIKASDNVTILKVKTGNITKTKSKIEKGISTLRIESQFLRSIQANLGEIKFDMILYSTPPITFSKVLKYYKKHHNSITYLMLKDIFPQNAVDLGYMSKNSLIHKFFRSKEISLYNNSDYIGCMSPKNKQYLLEHNTYLSNEKIEIFPNSITPIKFDKKGIDREAILSKLGIDSEKIIYLYGGNLGKPQGIDFLLEICSEFSNLHNEHIIIVGNGTEYSKIESFITKSFCKNVTLLSRLPKNDYDDLVGISDVGVILLSNKFTIPNFPSRLTSYLEIGIPVLAATDIVTDIKDVVTDGNFGLWSESSNIEAFMKNVHKLSNERLRLEMGSRARTYLDNNYNLESNVQIILKHLLNR